MTRWVCVGVIALLGASVVEIRAENCARGPTQVVVPNPFGGMRSAVQPRQLVSRQVRAPALTDGARLDRNGDTLPVGAVARYGSVRLRHSASLAALAFSSDGKVLASVSEARDGLRLWDASTGREIARLTSGITHAAFLPDGSLLVTDDGRCKHWQPVGNIIRELPEGTTPADSQALAINPDGRSFAVAAPQKVTLVDVRTGKSLRDLKLGADQALIQLAYSPDGRWLAGAAPKVGVLLWDLRTFKRVRTYRAVVEELTMAFNPSSSAIAVAGAFLHVYPLDSEDLPEDYKVPEGQFYSPRFSADGKWVLAMNSDADVVRVNAATGEVADPLNAPDPTLQTPLALAPATDRAAATDDRGGIHIWDPKTGKELELERHPALGSPAFSADGKTVWTLAADNRLHGFDAATGKSIKVIELPVEEGLRVHWEPRMRRAAFTLESEDAVELQLLDVDTGKVIHKHSFPVGSYSHIAFCSGDRNRIGLFTTEGVVVAQATTGKIVRAITTVKNGDAAQSRGEISPDGRLVSVAVAGRGLSVWEVVTGKKRFDFDALPLADKATFSPDGRYLAGWDATGLLVVFDMRLGTPVRRLHWDGDETTNLEAAFSPDGKRLAVGGRNGAIVVWEIATGETIVTFDRHEGFVTDLAWSPDGTRLASSSQDGTMLVWNVPAKSVAKVPEVLTVTGFEEAFRLLGSADAAAAQRGLDYLYRNPTEAVKQCAAQIATPTATPPARIAKLVADLEDEDFPVRQVAVRELDAVGGEATAPLRVAAAKSTSAEARKLATELLVRFDAPLTKPEDLRLFRVIEALECLNTAEAKAVLAKWASGPPGHRLTVEAAAAVARVKAVGN